MHIGHNLKPKHAMSKPGQQKSVRAQSIKKTKIKGSVMVVTWEVYHAEDDVTCVESTS